LQVKDDFRQGKDKGWRVARGAWREKAKTKAKHLLKNIGLRFCFAPSFLAPRATRRTQFKGPQEDFNCVPLIAP
jgi:hypothetical protein